VVDEHRTQPPGVTPNTEAAPATPARRSRWLEGVRGTVRFLVQQAPVALLMVDDGEVRVVKDDGPADTTVICRSQDDVDGLIRGELNPVVIGLLGRLEVEGDVALGIQVLHSLRVGPDSTAAR
jgi:hypothetical protein